MAAWALVTTDGAGNAGVQPSAYNENSKLSKYHEFEITARVCVCVNP